MGRSEVDGLRKFKVHFHLQRNCQKRFNKNIITLCNLIESFIIKSFINLRKVQIQIKLSLAHIQTQTSFACK